MIGNSMLVFIAFSNICGIFISIKRLVYIIKCVITACICRLFIFLMACFKLFSEGILGELLPVLTPEASCLQWDLAFLFVHDFQET